MHIGEEWVTNKWSGLWKRLALGEHVRNMFIDLVCGYTLREGFAFWGCIYGVMWVCMRWCSFVCRCVSSECILEFFMFILTNNFCQKYLQIYCWNTLCRRTAWKI